MTDEQMLEALESLFSEELPDQLYLDLFGYGWSTTKNDQLLLFPNVP